MLLGIVHFTFFRNNSILDMLHENQILLKDDEVILGDPTSGAESRRQTNDKLANDRVKDGWDLGKITERDEPPRSSRAGLEQPKGRETTSN